MKKLIYSLLFVLALSFQSCVSEGDPVGVSLGPGDPLPDFSVEMNNGEIVSSQSLYGKVGVIMFFNTDCNDCRMALPVMQRVWNYFKDNENVDIVLIAREESKKKIEEYWKIASLSMPFSPQENRNVFYLFAPGVIPRLYITNRSGVIKAAYGETDFPDYSSIIKTIERWDSSL